MPTKHKTNADLDQLCDRLREVRGQKGILGYILRGSDAASIDVKDPSKIMDYAVLSATAFEEGEHLTHTFGLGALNSAIVEGENIKVLLMTVGEHALSVFMERTVDHHQICQELHLA